jgi:tRNA pseudouridine synthase 10
MLGVEGKPGACWVCNGLFSQIEDWAERAVDEVEGIDFESYLFGVKLSARLRQMEAFFDERFHTGLSEPLKHAFNREVGKAFEAKSGHGTLDLTHPHLSFTIDLERDTVELRVLSLYIYGRYRKLTRGIPQTRWPCRKCRGKGCEACGFTGKQYPESVEELVSVPFLAAAGAEGAHLHGAGREDIDARMLGTGRPFILEVISPRRRHLDLPSLREAVNTTAAGKVEVSALRFVSRETVALVKETHAEKTYRARVSFERDVSQADLARALSSLLGTIEQRTPVRVSHRRADLVRERRLIEAGGTLLSPRKADLILRGEGGLYIKELISGDEGRTVPSLTGRLGVVSRVVELDVIDVTSNAFPDSQEELA